MDGRGYELLALITEEDILEIHRKTPLGKHRGTGIRNRGKLNQLVQELHEAAEKHRSVADILAMIFDDIERDPQPFVDCNHRTAMLLGRFVAKQFGLNLKYTGPEGRKLRSMWEFMSRAQLKEWVSNHLVAFKRD